jgi:uncharacterized protein (DUF2249 family)/quercetin dioxygenase-like cupin family protein
MTAIPEPMALEALVRFDDRHPTAVSITTSLPGQTLLIGLRAGQSLRPHRVHTPITIQIIRGEGSLTAAETTWPVHAGMLLPLAADVVHSATAERDMVLLVYRATLVEAESVIPYTRAGRADVNGDVLDVRALPPRERHGLIFARFDALSPGDAFRLINDHDPKPLRYQFAVEHAGEATWEPEQEGPDTWVIRIGKVTTAV